MTSKARRLLSATVSDRLSRLAQAVSLPPAVVDALIEHHLAVTYLPGATLYRYGSPADILCCILSGLVDIISPSGASSRLIQVCGPGDIIGHVDLQDHTGRRIQSFEARARTECKVALITRGELKSLLLTLDTLTLIAVVENLNRTWAGLVSSWMSMLGQTYRVRLYNLLMEFAKRFGVEDSRGTLITFELKQSDLAQMIGSSRATVSQLLDEMRKEGMLERRSMRYILMRRPKPGR
ncbi:MAG TPA: Crp/Fnr family transcriptional regulator [Candidatus Binataceae bacterium]|nr:Crp/Fnr family transcriptional regulator [Candidatus Binataceae bacterium]